MAKGLGPALVAEFSGLVWQGNSVKHKMPKYKDVAPFGQMPLLYLGEDRAKPVGQTTAIINTIAKLAKTEGEGADFQMSQMLIAQGEDIFASLARYVPTTFRALGEYPKAPTLQHHNDFWSTMVPKQCDLMEALIDERTGTFTSSGTSPGELYLFAVLHQMMLMHPTFLDSSPNLKSFYTTLHDHAKVKSVLTGESPMGPLKQYFMNPPAEEDKGQEA